MGEMSKTGGEDIEVRNLGIFAHVDAGKTTLTEQLLFASGTIRSAGCVDHGTSQTDSLDVERQRGISVKAAATGFTWKRTQIRIIDTPGHADFYAEVERSLCVLDGAILVVSAVEGVQLQTMTIWRALRELNIPTLIFVNKLDRIGADPGRSIAAISSQLSRNVVPVLQVSQSDIDAPIVVPIPDDTIPAADVIETLAGLDEGLAEKFLEDQPIRWMEAKSILRTLCREGKAYPVFFGAAKLGTGIEEFLDGVLHYLPCFNGCSGNDLSAVVFKIENRQSGRLSFVRVFEGTISRGAIVNIEPGGVQEKAGRILRLEYAGEYVSTDRLEAGDIGALYGMKETKVGYVVGGDYAIRRLVTTAEPMLTARIEPDIDEHWNDLLRALRELEDEDPLLQVEWCEGQREINVRFFGEVQMEIIRELLTSRFSIPATFAEPGVLYREIPKGSAEAKIEYRTNGYADIHIRVEPMPVGTGFHFESQVKADKIYFKFVKQIRQELEEARQQGPQGWEVTDLKVILLDGLSRYDLGTTPGDFKIVTPLVLKEALASAGTQLLEPMMSFEISVPEEYGAQVYRHLMRMRARFDEATPTDGRLIYGGLVPFAETFEHTSTLYAASHGQGVLRTRFHGYLPAESH